MRSLQLKFSYHTRNCTLGVIVAVILFYLFFREFNLSYRDLDRACEMFRVMMYRVIRSCPGYLLEFYITRPR